jgi:GR25 family glycosyltransferase involved in LPS biosynthesis
MNKINNNEINKNINRPPIYIISLKTRQDRLNKLKSKIEWEKVNVIEAVDGSLIENNTILKNSELGCFKSHILVWESAKEKNYNSILCLEDDVIISLPNQWRIIKYKMSFLPNNYDALFIGYNYVKNSKNGLKLEKLKGEIHGTHAIIWSKKGISKLNRLINDKDFKFDCPVDVWLGNLSKKNLNIYITKWPIVTVQNFFDSNIQFT